MAKLNNHLEVFAILPKTNCRKCGLPTCLAFAVAVIQGGKNLGDCPDLAEDVSDHYHVSGSLQPAQDLYNEDYLEELKARVKDIDLAGSARRLGARFAGERLYIRSMSKEFAVNQNGVITSDCHVNYAVSQALLSYVVSCRGLDPKGEWIRLRDMKGGADWGRFFEHRCELPLKKVLDNYTDLFQDILDILDGRPAPDSFDSDIAVVIYPVPRLPVLICYWRPEDGLESSSHIFFDVTAEDNLEIESIYMLCTGLVTMFEKFAQTHGQ